MYLSYKNLIRIISFTAAGALLLLGVIIREGIEIDSSRRRDEIGQIRSLQEAVSHVNSLTVGMQKASYAGTPARMSSLSAEVWRDAGLAKAALADLPLQGADLEPVNRFLSQVGDYAMHLSRKCIQGEGLTEEERSNCAKLARYAMEFNQNLAGIERIVSSGQMPVADYWKIQTGGLAAPTELQGLIGFREVADGFSGYPILIYDGPFSDNILKQAPKLTEGAQAIGPEQAADIAASFAGVPAPILAQGPDEESAMPSYTFRGGGADIAVTKQGGFVTYMTDSRSIGEKSISASVARRVARDYLREMGVDSMAETHHEVSNGICTVNFAYKAGEVICYTDLIKVGVAMDRGGVVAYDARGFISNHREREFMEPAIGTAEAAESVQPALRVERVRLALIPGAGGGEILTYEFLCADGDQNLLVYINAQNGVEERILLLLESANGTLTA